MVTSLLFLFVLAHCAKGTSDKPVGLSQTRIQSAPEIGELESLVDIKFQKSFSDSVLPDAQLDDGPLEQPGLINSDGAGLESPKGDDPKNAEPSSVLYKPLGGPYYLQIKKRTPFKNSNPRRFERGKWDVEAQKWVPFSKYSADSQIEAPTRKVEEKDEAREAMDKRATSEKKATDTVGKATDEMIFNPVEKETVPVTAKGGTDEGGRMIGKKIKKILPREGNIPLIEETGSTGERAAGEALTVECKENSPSSESPQSQRSGRVGELQTGSPPRQLPPADESKRVIK